MTFDELPQEDQIAEIKHEVARVCHLAQAHGFVVTVDLKPCEPLAMGSYNMRIDVRPARRNS